MEGDGTEPRIGHCRENLSSEKIEDSGKKSGEWSKGKDVGVVKWGEMKYGEKWNERRNRIEMRQKLFMCKLFWGGLKCRKYYEGRKMHGRFCMNQLSRTEFCVKTVTWRAWRAWIQVVWGMGRREIRWNCEEYWMLEVEESTMGRCKIQMLYMWNK